MSNQYLRKAKRNLFHPLFLTVAIIAVLALGAYALWDGNKHSDLLGSWVTTVDGMETGFQCGKQGIAASINNSTRQYNSWKLHKKNLLLKGKLFSDGVITDFCDTLKINKLNSKSLNVTQHGETISFHKIR
ncbi:MAG: hypothetical protein J6X58_06915 [Bacteroidales bacterium]|nr:hypothetical protein [Bacteroidales bacterium]